MLWYSKMQIGTHALILIIAIMSIASNAIGISKINDESKSSEKFLIANLVFSIFLVLIFGFFIYKDFRPNSAAAATSAITSRF